MRWPRRKRVDELLAAHASGGLEPAEERLVTAELAKDPLLRAELDEIAGTLAAVRAARPRPTEEPDWDAMAREIGRACDDAPPPAPRGLRRLWPPRPLALTVTAAGAAAIVVAIALSGHDRQALPEQATAPARDAAPAETPVTVDDEPDLPAGLDALSGDELADLEDALDREPEDAFVADLLAGTAERSAVEALVERDTDTDDDEPAIDPFRPDDSLPIDALADELPDEALDAIDRVLAEAQAG